MIETIHTRSDILLAKIQAKSPADKNRLIEALNYKVERVYEILFTLEKYEKKPTILNPIVQELRKALES